VSSLTVTCIRKHRQRQFYVVNLLVHGHFSRVATGSAWALQYSVSLHSAKLEKKHRHNKNTTFRTINLTGSNRFRTLLLVLFLRLLNPHVSLPFSNLSTGLRCQLSVSYHCQLSAAQKHIFASNCLTITANSFPSPPPFPLSPRPPSPLPL